MGQENIASIINDNTSQWADAAAGPRGNFDVTTVDGVNFTITRWEVPGVAQPTNSEVLAEEPAWVAQKQAVEEDPVTKIQEVEFNIGLAARAAILSHRINWDKLTQQEKNRFNDLIDKAGDKLIAVVRASRQ